MNVRRPPLPSSACDHPFPQPRVGSEGVVVAQEGRAGGSVHVRTWWEPGREERSQGLPGLCEISRMRALFYVERRKGTPWRKNEGIRY